MFKPTAFMAERVFGAIIAFGVKLMALALIIGISDAFLQTIAVPQTVTWQEAIELCVIALALCFLSLHAPGVAQSLLTGTPNLSFASISATAASAGVAASSAATTNTAMLSGGAAATLTAAGRFAGGGTAAAAAIPSASEGAPLLQRAAKTSAQASLFAAGGMRGLVTGATNSMVSQGMQAFSGGQQSVPSFRKHQQEAQIKQARQLVAEGTKKSVTPQSQTTQSKGSK
jgi:type IV secretory pathway TrbL component